MPHLQRTRVILPPEAPFSTWIGGSIIASLTTCQAMAVTRDELAAHGMDAAVEKARKGAMEASLLHRT